MVDWEEAHFWDRQVQALQNTPGRDRLRLEGARQRTAHVLVELYLGS